MMERSGLAAASTSGSRVTGTRAFATSSTPGLHLSLTGKTALVTGSTQGIGLGIAEELRKGGVALVVTGFGDAAEVERTRQRLADLIPGDDRVHYVPADLGKVAEDVEHLIKESEKKLGGPIDIVVNNAGIQHLSPIEDFPVEKWNQIIEINLNSVFHTMRLTLPAMKERGYGRIINISSVHGLVGSKHKAAYVAAKHGVVGLTKVAALEYAGSGVTINCINPGWVLTDLVRKQIEARAESLGVSYDEASRSLLAEKQPSETFATPSQIGQLAVFLSSDAASQITGISLPVDGGWTAQ
ncbi:3hydroxybutyrate dehydrogenase [Acanthamoeba castellanii str. Neff]|uniref:3-oxoacyl-[acyl-carrier-protein] reductase n=1 Tax=Acanthamoeba castellanii (strain ATCC 30010 / Neff) TaxID=1257118 RepID=L8GZZ0_ACACF|nr:3hydroxybutyrate dehydrogenase [Acanthamoeba castellanii str. Neff]ELR17671.1 3hydroxybutyrate dehydrogenase [Acanthamoeba castellanii str. Neff]